MKKKLLTSIILLLISATMAAPSINAHIISIHPVYGSLGVVRVLFDPLTVLDPNLDLGDQFSIDLTAENVENLWGYQSWLSFNPDVLHGVSVENGPFLGSAGGEVWFIPGAGFDNEVGELKLFGAVIYFEGTPPPDSQLPDGAGVLATVTFEVVGYGNSPITLEPETGLANKTGGWELRNIETGEREYCYGQILLEEPGMPPKWVPYEPWLDSLGHGYFSNVQAQLQFMMLHVDHAELTDIDNDGVIFGDELNITVLPPLVNVTMLAVPGSVLNLTMWLQNVGDEVIWFEEPNIVFSVTSSEYMHHVMHEEYFYKGKIEYDYTGQPNVEPPFLMSPDEYVTVREHLEVGQDCPETVTVILLLQFEYSLAEDNAPTCIVELQKDGVEIDEIDVEEFFDIYVGASTDDIDVEQVRFSSDDDQDNHPTGEWTQWYDWETSSIDWNASTKIKRWSFATPGYKEVWAQVTDNAGQTDNCSANIYVPGPYGPAGLSQCKTDGTEIPVGETIVEDTVVFKGVVSDPDGDQVKLQVELRRLDEYEGEFNETAGGFKNSSSVESGSEALAYAYGLADGEYHWRARTVDEDGKTSEWMEFGDNDIAEPDFRIPKILRVPYYTQGDTDWCLPTSMSMIFKYYGYPLHSWQIAKDLGWSREEIPTWIFQQDDVQDYFEQGVYEKRNLLPLPIEMHTNFVYPPSFCDIRDWIDDGRPILLASKRAEHAVVIVGYGVIDGNEKVYVHDPSGDLLYVEMGLPEVLPFIAVEVDWNDLKEYITLLSYLIAVGGTPSPPRGTIDVISDGVRFWEPIKLADEWLRVYNWLVGESSETGMNWEAYGHALKLNPNDRFQFGYPSAIVNHMGYSLRYILEVEFEKGAYRVSRTWEVPANSRNWNWCLDKLNTAPLRELLAEYGEYTITLTLWNEAHTELYDEIEFPRIEYKPLASFLLESPADLYITDPQGFHVGVDPSTGEVVNEIPGAVYTGPGLEPEVIAIPNPPDGAYEVQLIGTGTGDYSLTTELVTLEQTATQTYTGKIVEDAIYVYTVTTNDEAMTASPDPMAETSYFQEFFTNLPDDAFVADDPNEFVEFKKEMFDKINETREELDEDRYTEAIAKLNDMNEEVIVEAKLQTTTKSELSVIIDHVISSIETLQQA